MGSIIVSFPDIHEADLVFDDAETRVILEFFWPSRRSRIAAMDVTTDTRKFAQTLLVAAVDASYAMGYLDILVQTLIRRNPRSSMKALVRKLAKRYAKHWWKHATRDDLMDAQIYESIRVAIADKHITAIEERLGGLSQRGQPQAPFQIARNAIFPVVWG